MPSAHCTCPLSGVADITVSSGCCDIGAIPSGRWLQFIQDFEVQSQTPLVQGRDKHLNDGRYRKTYGLRQTLLVFPIARLRSIQISVA